VNLTGNTFLGRRIRKAQSCGGAPILMLVLGAVLNLGCLPLGDPLPTNAGPESPELLENLRGTLLVGKNAGGGATVQIKHGPRLEQSLNFTIESELLDVGGFVHGGRIAIACGKSAPGSRKEGVEIKLVDVESSSSETIWAHSGWSSPGFLIVSPDRCSLILWLENDHVVELSFVNGKWQEIGESVVYLEYARKPVWHTEGSILVTGSRARSAESAIGSGTYEHGLFQYSLRSRKLVFVAEALWAAFGPRAELGVCRPNGAFECRYISADAENWPTGDVAQVGMHFGDSSFMDSNGIVLMEALPTHGRDQVRVRGFGGPSAKWSFQAYNPQDGRHATIVHDVWYQKFAFQDATLDELRCK